MNATHERCREFPLEVQAKFQWAPTLGGECYVRGYASSVAMPCATGFNGHPPLGVNATIVVDASCIGALEFQFQWAPTLGGECYSYGPAVEIPVDEE